MYLMNTNVFKSDSKYLASGPWLTPTSPEFLNRLPMWIWKSQSFFLNGWFALYTHVAPEYKEGHWNGFQS